MSDPLRSLATDLFLGNLLDELRHRYGGYGVVEHYREGAHHHDIVLRLERAGNLPADVLVVSTNAAGIIKELLCMDAVPTREALWRYRRPEIDPTGDRIDPPVLGCVRSLYWFEPCTLSTQREPLSSRA